MTQNETLLLGIDIGTTGTKCAIYDLKGELVAHAYQEYSMIHPAAVLGRAGPPIAGGTPSRRICTTALSSRASTAAASPPSA